MNRRYQAHQVRPPRFPEDVYVVRDALVLFAAVVVIVLLAGLNG